MIISKLSTVQKDYSNPNDQENPSLVSSPLDILLEPRHNKETKLKIPKKAEKAKISTMITRTSTLSLTLNNIDSKNSSILQDNSNLLPNNEINRSHYKRSQEFNTRSILGSKSSIKPSKYLPKTALKSLFKAYGEGKSVLTWIKSIQKTYPQRFKKYWNQEDLEAIKEKCKNSSFMVNDIKLTYKQIVIYHLERTSEPIQFQTGVKDITINYFNENKREVVENILQEKVDVKDLDELNKILSSKENLPRRSSEVFQNEQHQEAVRDKKIKNNSQVELDYNQKADEIIERIRIKEKPVINPKSLVHNQPPQIKELWGDVMINFDDDHHHPDFLSELNDRYFFVSLKDTEITTEEIEDKDIDYLEYQGRRIQDHLSNL